MQIGVYGTAHTAHTAHNPPRPPAHPAPPFTPINPPVPPVPHIPATPSIPCHPVPPGPTPPPTPPKGTHLEILLLPVFARAAAAAVLRARPRPFCCFAGPAPLLRFELRVLTAGSALSSSVVPTWSVLQMTRGPGGMQMDTEAREGEQRTRGAMRQYRELAADEGGAGGQPDGTVLSGPFCQGAKIKVPLCCGAGATGATSTPPFVHLQTSPSRGRNRPNMTGSRQC